MRPRAATTAAPRAAEGTSILRPPASQCFQLWHVTPARSSVCRASGGLALAAHCSTREVEASARAAFDRRPESFGSGGGGARGSHHGINIFAA